MTPAEREAFYDAEVAPVLLDLGKKCQVRGMAFFALVDWSGEGNVGRTLSLPVKSPAIIRYAEALARCDCGNGAVNIDSFMFAIMKEAREIGHSSIILHQLGVALKP